MWFRCHTGWNSGVRLGVLKVRLVVLQVGLVGEKLDWLDGGQEVKLSMWKFDIY